MAKILGESGRYLTDAAQNEWRKFTIVVFCLMAVLGAIEGFILATWVGWNPLPMWSKVTIGIAIFPAMFALDKWADRRMQEIDRKRMSFTKGAVGENAVAKALTALPDELYVINDLATPFGNLDHVVVGPTGVFVLDAKAWRGTVAADGRGELLLNGKPTEKPFIRQFVGRMLGIRDKVRILAPGLDPFYQPLFVFTCARVEANWGTTGSVHCLREDQLRDYITERKPNQKLRPEEVQTLAQAFLGLAHMDSDFTAKASAPSATAPSAMAPTSTAVPPPPAARPTPVVDAKCGKCGGPVSKAEANFCRAKSRKLGGRILCRPCQQPLLAGG